MLPAGARPSSRRWLRASDWQPGIYYEYYIYQHSTGVWLMLDRDREQNKALFDGLKAEQEAIEAACGQPLIWKRHDETRFSSLGATLTQAGYADPGSWPAIYDALLDGMPRLEQVFRPYLEQIMQ